MNMMGRPTMQDCLAMIREGAAETIRRERILSEGQRLDAWKSLRAEFEKRMTELLEGSDFAGGDVPYILNALADNAPKVSAWEEFISNKGE